MKFLQTWHGRLGHVSDRRISNISHTGKMPVPLSHRRGFTMIELIVALGMVAMIAASLSSTLWSAYHATRETEAAVAPTDKADIALEFLASDLQNALQTQTLPVSSLVGTAVAANNYEQTAFYGTQGQDERGHPSDDVVFFTTAESPVHVYANGEIKCVEYKVVQPLHSSDHVLVRRVIRNLLPTSGQTGATDEEVICTGVSSFSVEYSADGTNFSPTSLGPDTWDSSQTQEDTTIPAAVKVTLELEETLPNGKAATSSYTRIIMLPCSTASLDPNVNPGAS